MMIIGSKLSHKALSTYAAGMKIGIPWYRPQYVSFEFIPMFKREGYVWIHVASVVRYCHLMLPDEFGELNNANLLRDNRTYVLNNGRNLRSFRLMKIDEFEQATGVKVGV